MVGFTDANVPASVVVERQPDPVIAPGFIGARPKVVFDTPEYPAEERVKMYYYANMSTIKKRDIPRAAKMIIKGLIAGK